MTRLLGLIRLFGVVLMVVVIYATLLAMDENARTWSNQQTIATRWGFYGILTVGVGVLIVAGGIDLSIGSVVGLAAILFGLQLEGLPIPELLQSLGLPARLAPVPPALAALNVLLLSAVIGLIHGLLVTGLRLQPFLVTLCGLFIYRGLARWLSSSAVGLGVNNPADFRAGVDEFRSWLVGERIPLPFPGLWQQLWPEGTEFYLPQQFVLLVGLTVILGLFLHGTRHGRYLFAIGANEDAARYAGIPTNRYKVLAYVVSSLLAGLGGILLILESRSVNATNAGSWLELYAITGAVLGGCSLRGGEGSVLGMFLGAAVLPLLRQLCSFGGISNELEYAVIGAALLLGTIADETLKRLAARRG
jgi:ribose transport system permease protein